MISVLTRMRQVAMGHGERVKAEEVVPPLNDNIVTSKMKESSKKGEKEQRKLR